MNSLNKYLPIIIGSAIAITILFFSFTHWQLGRFDRLEKELHNKSVIQRLQTRVIEAQIDRLMKDQSNQGYISVNNTTQLYQFLTRIASDNQLLVLRINLNPQKTGNEPTNPPMEVVLAGNYQHTIDFLTGLRQLDKLQIQKMDLTANTEDPSQSLQLRLLFNRPVISEVGP